MIFNREQLTNVIITSPSEQRGGTDRRQIVAVSVWLATPELLQDSNAKMLRPSSQVFLEGMRFSLNTLDTVTSMLLSHAVLMNWTGFRFDWKTSDYDIWIWFQPIRLYTKMYNDRSSSQIRIVLIEPRFSCYIKFLFDMLRNKLRIDLYKLYDIILIKKAI